MPSSELAHCSGVTNSKQRTVISTSALACRRANTVLVMHCTAGMPTILRKQFTGSTVLRKNTAHNDKDHLLQ